MWYISGLLVSVTESKTSEGKGKTGLFWLAAAFRFVTAVGHKVQTHGNESMLSEKQHKEAGSEGGYNCRKPASTDLPLPASSHLLKVPKPFSFLPSSHSTTT